MIFKDCGKNKPIYNLIDGFEHKKSISKIERSVLILPLIAINKHICHPLHLVHHNYFCCDKCNESKCLNRLGEVFTFISIFVFFLTFCDLILPYDLFNVNVAPRPVDLNAFQLCRH